MRTKYEVFLGDRLKLKCGAIGKPPPLTHWYRGDSQLLIGSQVKPRIRINKFTLTVHRVEVVDGGAWSCKVWNRAGEIWRNFTVEILGNVC